MSASAGKSGEKETPEMYLRRKGWVKHKKPHLWIWQLPPEPGLHQFQDALDVQKSLDNVRKSKHSGTAK